MARHTDKTITLEQYNTNDTSWYIMIEGVCVGVIHDLNIDREIAEMIVANARRMEEVR